MTLYEMGRTVSYLASFSPPNCRTVVIRAGWGRGKEMSSIDSFDVIRWAGDHFEESITTMCRQLCLIT